MYFLFPYLWCLKTNKWVITNFIFATIYLVFFSDGQISEFLKTNYGFKNVHVHE